MRIGLLTEGGYPYVSGEARLWCDRLVRGLGPHEFDLYALSRSRRQEEEGWVRLPRGVARVRTAPLWTPPEEGPALGRRARRRFAALYAELAAALTEPRPVPPGEEHAPQADRFRNALYGLADLARTEGGLAAALRSETAVRALERACRAPGAPRAAQLARVGDLLDVTAHIERALRPLSLDWYAEDGLAAADLSHAASGGSAALPGLLAQRLHGVPLLVTEYGVQLRAHYLGAGDASRSGPAVRALLAAFHGRLAEEVYARAALITPGNSHARRWQERCGAERAKLRLVYPGMDAARFAEAGESTGRGDRETLVWIGRVDPAKDLVCLLHAFAAVRRERPGVRLRVIGAPAEGEEAAAYLAQCRVLAAQLFPDEAAGAHEVGVNPVSFEEIGSPEVPDLAAAYTAGAVVVLSSVVEGFPISLVESMFCGRATVSTDVGAVVEVIGGTGLVVPPRNPRALAEACLGLLRDPARRERLGAAARARALELFTVEQNIEAFRALYLEIVSHCPVPRELLDAAGEPLPFAVPAEAHLPGHWTAAEATESGARPARWREGHPGRPRWARTPTSSGDRARAGTAGGGTAGGPAGETTQRGWGAAGPGGRGPLKSLAGGGTSGADSDVDTGPDTGADIDTASDTGPAPDTGPVPDIDAAVDAARAAARATATDARPEPMGHAAAQSGKAPAGEGPRAAGDPQLGRELLPLAQESPPEADPRTADLGTADPRTADPRTAVPVAAGEVAR
ncbi:GT4 family glycosyltransferase PelF [Streptomyces sp. SCSIO ZS0520]|uniref:GT4 family glycosyltransferase PelF n=1 Tax=Streptomyces sp. SCSIO ZS0520 TaxID=2892996 RepID=UPI003985E0EC